MIYLNTKLQVIDNSSAKLAKIIQIRNKKYLSITSIVNIVIKKTINNNKINKKLVYLGLLTHIKNWNLRIDSTIIKFNKNTCVLLDKTYKLLFNKVIYPFIKDFFYKICLNHKFYQKIVIYIKNYF